MDILKNQNDFDNAVRLKELFSAHMKPLVSDVMLEGPYMEEENSRRDLAVSFDTKHRIRIYFSRESTVYFTLKRSVPFSIEEKIFLEDLVLHISSYRAMGRDVMTRGQEIVEKCIARNIDAGQADMVFRLIRLFSTWAEQKKDGDDTALTAGIYFNKNKTAGENIFARDRHDYLLKLGSARDMMLVLSNNGMILKWENIAGYKAKHPGLLAPLAFENLASWTDSRHKAAICLTPGGEILLFKNKKLLFAKKGRRWRCLPHSLLINNFIMEYDDEDEKSVRKAAYLTSLDLAFAGRDKDIVLILAPNEENAMKFFFPAAPEVCDAVRTIAGSKKFFEIPRPQRTELCLAGETIILDRSGRIIAAAPQPDQKAVPVRNILSVFKKNSRGIRICGGNIEILKK